MCVHIDVTTSESFYIPDNTQLGPNTKYDIIICNWLCLP